MAVVEHGAEHPLLRARVPIRPRVAADLVTPAGAQIIAMRLSSFAIRLVWRRA
jgi:hypothetical protein